MVRCASRCEESQEKGVARRELVPELASCPFFPAVAFEEGFVKNVFELVVSPKWKDYVLKLTYDKQALFRFGGSRIGSFC
jgi:hypothetical protein